MSRSSLEQAVPPDTKILLDTSVILAYLNARETVSPAATVVIDEFVRTGRNRVTISAVSVAETLMRPFAAGASAVALVEGFLLHFPNLTILGVDYETVREAGRLRAVGGLKTPDALVIATALSAGLPIVVTNDARWASALTAATHPITLCHLDAYVPL